MVNQELLTELKTIIKEDYGMELQPRAVTEVADTLVGYFGLLAKINIRERSKQEESYGETQQS